MIEILSPGLLSTVQDLGRTGLRHLGVGTAGAGDRDALRIANRLIGNAEGAAAIEVTLTGPTLRFRHEHVVAVCGAEFDIDCGGERIPAWRPVRMRPGAVLRIGRTRRGARACIAVAGGIDVPVVLGSRSTDLRGGFGGFEGRALAAGDRLRVGTPAPVAQRLLATRHPERECAVANWWVEPTDDLRGELALLHVLDGAHARGLDRHSIRAAWENEWTVGPSSDRMGVRFEGPPLHFDSPLELVSEAIVPGTVQLPPDGRPIVLGVDAQTTGGYPRIAHVIASDLCRLMQLRPGERVRSVRVTREAADAARATRRLSLARLGEAIAMRLAAA